MATQNKVSIGELPPETSSKGGLNESTPMSQRVPTVNVELSDGPRLGEKGEYLPASYVLPSMTPGVPGNIRTDR